MTEQVEIQPEHLRRFNMIVDMLKVLEDHGAKTSIKTSEVGVNFFDLELEASKHLVLVGVEVSDTIGLIKMSYDANTAKKNYNEDGIHTGRHTYMFRTDTPDDKLASATAGVLTLVNLVSGGILN